MNALVRLEVSLRDLSPIHGADPGDAFNADVWERIGPAPRRLSGTGRRSAVRGTSRKRAVSATGRNRAVSGTGRKRAVSATGRNRAVSGTGRKRAVSATGRNRAVSGTGGHPRVHVKGTNRTKSVSLSRDESEAARSLRAKQQPVVKSSSVPWVALLTAAAAVVAVAVAFFHFRPQGPGAIAVVSATVNNLRVQREGREIRVPIDGEIHLNDRIFTDKTGATIAYNLEATTLELAPNTRVRLKVLSTGKHVELDRGWMTVTAARQPAGQTLSVKTPHAVLTVVGTKFTVGITEQQTVLEVEEGEVHVKSAKQPASLPVTAGNFTVVSPIEAPVVKQALGVEEALLRHGFAVAGGDWKLGRVGDSLRIRQLETKAEGGYMAMRTAALQLGFVSGRFRVLETGPEQDVAAGIGLFYNDGRKGVPPDGDLMLWRDLESGAGRWFHFEIYFDIDRAGNRLITRQRFWDERAPCPLGWNDVVVVEPADIKRGKARLGLASFGGAIEWADLKYVPMSQAAPTTSSLTARFGGDPPKVPEAEFIGSAEAEVVAQRSLLLAAPGEKRGLVQFGRPKLSQGTMSGEFELLDAGKAAELAGDREPLEPQAGDLPGLAANDVDGFAPSAGPMILFANRSWVMVTPEEFQPGAERRGKRYRFACRFELLTGGNALLLHSAVWPAGKQAPGTWRTELIESVRDPKNTPAGGAAFGFGCQNGILFWHRLQVDVAN